MPRGRGDPVVAVRTAPVQAPVLLDRPPAGRQPHGEQRQRPADDRGDEPPARGAALLIRQPPGKGGDEDEIDQKHEQDGMHFASIRRTAVPVRAVPAATMVAGCPGPAGRDCHRRRIWSNATPHPEIGRPDRGHGAHGRPGRGRTEPPVQVARRCQRGVCPPDGVSAFPGQPADGPRHRDSDADRRRRPTFGSGHGVLLRLVRHASGRRPLAALGTGWSHAAGRPWRSLPAVNRAVQQSRPGSARRAHAGPRRCAGGHDRGQLVGTRILRRSRPVSDHRCGWGRGHRGRAAYRAVPGSNGSVRRP